MEDHVFEYELSPYLKAQASFETERQNLEEGLKKAKSKFAITRKRLFIEVFIAVISIIVWKSSWPETSFNLPFLFFVSLIFLPLIYFGVFPLLSTWRDVAAARKRLDDWENTVRDCFNSGLKSE